TRVFVATLDRALLILPFGDERDHRMRCIAVELRGVRPLEPSDVSCVFDDRQLHAQTDPEVRDLTFARIADRGELPFDSALTKAARHEDGVGTLQATGAMLLDFARLDETNVDSRATANAGMGERLGQRDVRVAQIDVLAHQRDRYFHVGVCFGRHDLPPLRQVRRRDVQAQLVDDDVVQALGMEHEWDLVNVVDVDGGDHGALLHVREEGDLPTLLLRKRFARTTQQNVWLDADRAQLLHRMLRRLRFDLAGSGNVRNQRQMNIDDVVASELDTELPDRFQERQRLDVTYRAADLDHAHVGVAGTQADAMLDLVGHVRDDL